MCGICGVIQVTGSPRPVLSASRLAAMTDVIAHRGPDDWGSFLDDGIALGVRRLSIVDVEGGHQPFSSENGDVWAAQNGELYNHDDLRDRLVSDGHVFRSRCDSEVLPHLYERYGTDLPTQLRGMFALAVWDGRRRRALLARDRLGIKPLYYARCDDVIVFASELKSILASGLVEPTVDHEAVDALLTFGFVPGPMTPLAGVSKLLPGHVLVVEDGRALTKPYWEYPPPGAGDRRSEETYQAELLELLEESVKLRLMSDVPLGAMLSGGLDSTLVVALMAKNMPEPVKTFSVGFAEAGAENELADARLIAEHFATDHHELELSFAEDTVALEDLVWYLDEPLADLSAIGFLALCKLASSHVTVALSGQGADELFGGYTKHRAASLVAGWKRVPSPLRSLGNPLLRHAPGGFRRAGRTLAAADPADRLLEMSGKVDPALRRELARGPLAGVNGDAARRAAYRCLDGIDDDPLPAALYLDAQLALVDDMLHYFDRSSMAYSLEVRVPFLDHRLVEYAATIPGDLKVRRLRTKHILKETARGLIPQHSIDKRKVGFFRGSVGGWFQAQAERASRDYLLQEEPRYAEFLDPGAVRRLVARQTQNVETPERHLLLAILMLEIWLSTYVPRACAAGSNSRDRVTLPS